MRSIRLRILRSMLIITLSSLLIFALVTSTGYAKERDSATVSEVTEGSNMFNSSDLIGGSVRLNGREILYEGEVIGDIMRRGDHAWVNIHDGQNAIGVYLTTEQSKMIKHAGDYKDTGDRVLVSGKFNRACDQHGGELDIHARLLTVTMPGVRVPHPIDIRLLATAVVLVFVTGLLYLLSHFRHHENDETEETLI